MLVDSHCHLHDPQWFSPEQISAALADAKSHQVTKMICIGTNPADSVVARDFAAKHPQIFWTYGIHPEFAEQNQDHKQILNHFQKSTIDCMPVAIGEIGLDYHYSPETRPQQIRLFEQMLQLARDHRLPVSLHIREAFSDAWPILDNFSGVTGVVHSFTGNKRELSRALDRGFFIGVNGLVTYSSLPLPPIENMLLETDAPFLTPVPKRGTMNTPGYVRYVAAYLSEKMGVAVSFIESETTKNVKKLFQI